MERIAPKGKIQGNEPPELTCVREIAEESWLDINQLHIKWKAGNVLLSGMNFGQWVNKKNIEYYIVEYAGSPDDIRIQVGEWFTGMYKRATIEQIIWLVHHGELRIIFRESHDSVMKLIAKQKAMDTLASQI